MSRKKNPCKIKQLKANFIILYRESAKVKNAENL